MRLSSFVSSIALVASFSSLAADAASAPPPTAAPAPVVAASSDRDRGAPARTDDANAFTFAMYRQLRGGRGNLFFSGTSVRDALGLAYLGARGATASEMASALRFDPDASRAAALAKTETADWNAARGQADLAVANRLWADARFPLRADYVQNAKDAYGAPVSPVDFRNDADGARRTIDRWVSDRTHARIPELLPEGSLSDSTRLVITNAIYFKGSWATPFDKSATSDDAFAKDGLQGERVPTMHRTGRFSVAARDGMTMLELPYGKSDLAMDVILPDARDGLPKVEADLRPESFTRWTSALSSERKVEVSLPKFKVSWGKSLTGDLRALGVQRLFGAADLSGIAKGDLAVTDVVHKAFVAVDEEGTEAAAATGVVVEATAVTLERRPIVFKADHPFVFVVRDVKRGRVLFIGRVTDPKA